MANQFLLIATLAVSLGKSVEDLVLSTIRHVPAGGVKISLPII